MKQNDLIKENKIINTIEKSIFALLLFFIFFSPYHIGLRDEIDRMYGFVFIALIFCIYCIINFIQYTALRLKKPDETNKTHLAKLKSFTLANPFDFVLLGMVLTYTFSLVFAAGLRAALIEWLGYIMLFILFYMISRMVKGLTRKIYVLWTIVITALGAAVLGIDTVSGDLFTRGMVVIYRLLGLNSQYFDAIRDANSLYDTVIGYSNTSAIFMAFAFFAAVTLILLSKAFWQKSVAITTGLILLIPLIPSNTIGGILVFFVAAILFVFITNNKNRVFVSIYILSSSIIAFIVGQIINTSVSNNNYGVILWLVVLVAVTINTLINMMALKKYDIDTKGEVSNKNTIITFGAIIGVVIIFIISIFILVNIPGELINSTLNKGMLSSRSYNLKNGESYTLAFDYEIQKQGKDEDGLRVKIESINKTNILAEQGLQEEYKKPELLNENNELFDNTDTSQKVAFSIPDDSELVKFSFLVEKEGISVVVKNIKLTNINTGKVKHLAIKDKFGLYRYIQSFSHPFKTTGFQARLIFFKDALKVLKDYPLFGAGGKAWNVVYQKYQSYLYFTKDTHSYFFETLVETGFIGILVLIALLLLIPYTCLLLRKGYKKDSTDYTINNGLFVMLIILFGHAIFDLDFSYPVIGIMAWSTLGLMSVQYNNADTSTEDRLIKKIQIKELKANILIPALLLIVMLILPINIISGDIYLNKANKAMTEGKYAKALPPLQKAVASDSRNESYSTDFVNLYTMVYPEPTEDNKIMLLETIYKASQANKTNSELLFKIAGLFYNLDNYELALNTCDTATEYKPLYDLTWQQKMIIYWNVAESYMAMGDINSGYEVIKRALNSVEQMKAYNKNNMMPIAFNAITMEYIERMQFISDNIDSGITIDISGIKLYNLPALDVDEDGSFDRWESNNCEITYNENGSMTLKPTGEDAYIESRTIYVEPSVRYIYEMWTDSYDEDIEIELSPIFSRIYIGKNLENDMYMVNFTPTHENVEKEPKLRIYIQEEITILKILLSS